MGTNRTLCDLDQPAHADLVGSKSIAEMGNREGWTPDLYAVALAQQIREDGQSLGTHLERMQALAGTGPSASSASAAELSRHFVILNALFDRHAHLAAQVVDPTSRRGAEAVERLTTTAIKCQRAATAALGAMHTLRQAEAPTTPERPSSGHPGPCPAASVADGVEAP